MLTNVRSFLPCWLPVLCLSTACATSGPSTGSSSLATPNTPGFVLSSSKFNQGGAMPLSSVFNSFGCVGGNHSPDLRWDGVPFGTKSFALIVHDPDAPTGSGWNHWLAFNIPINVHELPESFEPGMAGSSSPYSGVTYGITDFGRTGYGGPCPPPGAPHHYRFTLYALDVPHLELDATTTAARFRYSIRDHVVGTTTLEGIYGR